MPPLCEEAIMHLQILSQSDHYTNLISWSYFVLCIILVSLIARELNLGNKWEMFAAALAATLPMAIFQATGCKNDTVLSFLVLTFVLSLIRLRKGWNILYSFVAGIAIGLGIYCKGTFLLIGGSCGISIIIIELLPRYRSQSFIDTLKILSLTVAIGVLISLPYWIRELNTNFSGFKYESSIQNNEDKSIDGIIANTVRSAAIHLSLPINKWNASLYKAVNYILGAHLNDPRTTFPNYSYLTYYWPHEDHAGNPIHLIVIVISIIYLIIKLKYIEAIEALILLSLLISILGFNIMLKWQPWMSRLHTPLFFLGILLATIVLYDISKLNIPSLSTLPHIILILASISAIPGLIYNYSRPLITSMNKSILEQDRIKMYFANRPEIMQDYLNIDNILRSSNVKKLSIGIVCGNDDWEYPLLVLSGATAGSEKAEYKLHQVQENISETILIGLGLRGKTLLEDHHLRLVYKGEYASLFQTK